MLQEISKTQYLSRDPGDSFLLDKAKHMCTQDRYDFFSCKYPAASCNRACILRNLKCFKCLSSDELSIPIKPPYGLYFKTKSKLIPASKNKQVAKKILKSD